MDLDSRQGKTRIWPAYETRMQGAQGCAMTTQTRYGHETLHDEPLYAKPGIAPQPTAQIRTSSPELLPFPLQAHGV